MIKSASDIFRFSHWILTVLACSGLLAAAGSLPVAAGDGPVPPTIRLSANGVAPHPIVVAETASDAVCELANTLSGVLGRIGGATLTVETGDGSRGIALGTATDFPVLDLADRFDPADPMRREEYLLRTHAGGLLLVGATENALAHAVWDLCYRLGYRQFFPGPTWEVFPPPGDIAIALDSFEAPDFRTRRIWYGHGLWGYNARPYAEWCARNRAVPGFGLATRHMYQTIIRRRREVLDANPEFLALVDGERRGPKLCIGNPGLRALVLDFARDYFQKNPDADCLSMDPSDGGGWCECADCAALGSISDQALTLANTVAETVSREFPGKYVGLLAYNQHSPPPRIDVHPNVLVKVQTAFIRGGYSFDELVQGWQARGAVTGVGDYYSVFLWDMSRPASQRGSDLPYIVESIPRFHRMGARFFMSESSDLWGAIGLGHYLAARLLWDVGEAEQADRLLDDFLTRAFGPARVPMERFYRRIYRFAESDRRPLIRGDMLARMYRALDKARTLDGNNAAIRARLDDLLLYTRYEELFQRYQAASGTERQAAIEDLLRHTWRMRETMMLHAKPIVMRLAGRDSHVTQPPREVYQSEEPFTEAEKAAILAEGIAGTRTVEIGFEPIAFSGDLVPAAPLNLVTVEDGTFNAIAPTGRQTFYTWRDETDPAEFRLRVSGGHIVHYRSIASPVQVRLFADANPLLDEPVAFDHSVPPDGETRDVSLVSPFTGLHRIEVFPPTNRAMVEPGRPGQALTQPAGLDAYNRLNGRWSLYFYVPKGTDIVGIYAAGSQRGQILDGDGNPVFAFAEMDLPGYFAVPVPEGQDGALWKFDDCIGRRALLTVPPWLARRATELLLPREVVACDAEEAP